MPAAPWEYPGSTLPAIQAELTKMRKIGTLGIRIGLGWAKSHRFTTGQCPVMRYNRQLMMCILHDKVQIAKAVNATVIALEDAPQGYRDFDQGAAKKFVLTPTECWLAIARRGLGRGCAPHIKDQASPTGTCKEPGSFAALTELPGLRFVACRRDFASRVSFSATAGNTFWVAGVTPRRGFGALVQKWS